MASKFAHSISITDSSSGILGLQWKEPGECPSFKVNKSYNIATSSKTFPMLKGDLNIILQSWIFAHLL